MPTVSEMIDGVKVADREVAFDDEPKTSEWVPSDEYLDAIELIEAAEDALSEAIMAIRALAREVPPLLSGSIEAYLLPVLLQAMSSDNEYLGGGNPANLYSLREELRTIESHE